MNFRPIDASKECGVTVNTIRNWCRSYSEFLSAGASVESDERVLTGQDIEILKYIAALRREKMQKPLITQRLRETSFGLTETLDSPQIGHAIVSLDAPEAPEAAPQTIMALDAITTLQRRVESLEQSSRAGWWYIALGIMIGLGLAVVFELAAIVASR